MSKLESRYPKMVVMVRIRNPDRSLVKEFTFNYHVDQERKDFASKIVDAYLAHQSVETFALLGNSLEHVTAGDVKIPAPPAPVEIPIPSAPVEKKWRFHYLDGKTEEFMGVSAQDAFTKAGYGRGALCAIKYYEEVK